MSFPIRCFSCNKVIGNKWETYNSQLELGNSIIDTFAVINIRRYCCKRMFLGHVEIADKLLMYSEIKRGSNEKSTK